jgi:hypothetical protein
MPTLPIRRCIIPVPIQFHPRHRTPATLLPRLLPLRSLHPPPLSSLVLCPFL